MRYETLKSFVLFILVCSSVFLTWSLWTYQPNYESIDPKSAQSIMIAEKREISELIKPITVLYHLDGETYGTTDEEYINQFIREIGTMSFYEFRRAPLLNEEKVKEILNTGDRIVVRYPDEVPFGLYKGVLQITDQVPQASFDRIVIQSGHNEQGNASIYFINTSTTEWIAYQSNINPERSDMLFKRFNYSEGFFEEYTEIKLTDGKNMYLPANEKEIIQYKYLYDTYDPDKFKDALFRNPNRVIKGTYSNSVRYTDDRSLMDVNYLSNVLLYVNPGANLDTQEESQEQVLGRSIEFVNEHAGWTDNYRYASISTYEKRIVYRLYMHGLPVFNEQGMTEIRQHLGTEEIFQYRRPYFTLDFPLPEKKRVVLPNGEEAYQYLLSTPGFNPLQLQDMTIGYRLSKDSSNSRVIVLEPSWYYLYAGSWLRLDFGDVRRGL